MNVLRVVQWPCIAVLLAGNALAQVAPVPGWFLTGANRRSYVIGIDRQIFHSGEASGAISCSTRCEGFGSLAQRISAANYLRRRVRFSAWVRAERGGKPRLWMRVDGEGGKILAFDNMDNRGKGGPFEWRQQVIVLDVPESATEIYFGLILDAKGAAWLDDSALDVVDSKTKVTGSQFVTIARREPPHPEAQPTDDTGSILSGIARAQSSNATRRPSGADNDHIANAGFEERRE